MAFLRPLARIWMLLLGATALALTGAVVARFSIPLIPLSPAPQLVAADPPDQAREVRPDQALILQFNTPMNRLSTISALRIVPDLPGALDWSADAQTLTFTPSNGFAPATTYQVSLDQTALGQWWRPLASPVQLSFRTALQPAVIAALPQTESDPSTPLAVIFSQPMVATANGEPATPPPPVQISPATALEAFWLTPQTLLLRANPAFAPATTYAITLEASLANVREVPLGTPFRWEMRTAWPPILARAPADQATQVRPGDPLTLTLGAPLSLSQIRQALQIRPQLPGQLTLTDLDVGQLITFEPDDGWAYDTTYTVALIPPAAFNAPPAWRFRTTPQPRLVAFSPGQDQTLAPDNAMQLVFSTPMDEAALRAGISFEPPVSALALSVNGTEARLRPTLQPATVYTLTLAAELSDLTGEPLGSAVSLRVSSAPAQPALTAPDARARIIPIEPNQPASVRLLATNLSALDLSLYPLDTPTLLRALNLGTGEWANFSPERYGQRLARRWRTLPPSPTQPLVVPVGLSDGEPLEPGAYYLRVTSPEGPRTDLLLLVGEARLSMRRGSSYALVWVTTPTGTPLADRQVALYAADQLIAEGQTDAEGLWRVTLTMPMPGPLLALTTQADPAVARSDWRLSDPVATASSARSLLVVDQSSYQPGDQISVQGFVRVRDERGSVDLPANEIACRLQVRGPNGSVLSATTPCLVDPGKATLSGKIQLAPRLAPGSYTLAASVGDEQITLPIRVEDPAATPLLLDVQPQPKSLRVQPTSPASLAVTNPLTWELELEALPLPSLPAGFELALDPANGQQRLSGVAQLDADGWLELALPPLAGLTSYRLSLSDPSSEPPLHGSQSGLIGPNPRYAALALPSRLVANDQRSRVELLALDGLGQPQAGTRLRVEVFRVGATGAPLLVRQANADRDGRASVELVQLNPGIYEISAEAGGPIARTRLWVYGTRPTTWPTSATSINLIADREQYAPGDVATLLVAAPPGTGSLMLSLEQGDLREARARPLVEGQLVRLPITADMAPGVVIGALVHAADRTFAGELALTVRSPQPSLEVSIGLDPSLSLQPGASSPLSISTQLADQPVDADLLVTLSPYQPGRTALGLERFAPGAPQRSTAAALLGAGNPGPIGASPVPRPQPHGVSATLTPPTESLGLRETTLRLPAAPGVWQLSVYAASGPNQVASATRLITTSLPLRATLTAPERMAQGDSAEFALELSNPRDQPITVTVRASHAGLQLVPPLGPNSQVISLDPGASSGLAWQASPAPDASSARLRFQFSGPSLNETLEHALSFAPAASPATTSTTIVAQGALATTLALDPTADGLLTLTVAPGLRAALIAQATRLAALNAPSNEERAALALIAAYLADGAVADERANWASLANRMLEDLSAVQHEDGGWGWWPATPSAPFSTAFILEAQASVQAILGSERNPSLRAVAYLRRTAPNADLATRAYAAYALARAGHADQSVAPPSLASLEADGLAFVALALPPTQNSAALDQLQAQALRTQTGVSWLASSSGDMPRSPTAVTAAATQALRIRRPNASELAGAERSLLAAWSDTGWSSAYAAARVAAALLPARPNSAPVPVTLRLAATPVISPSTPLSQTVTISMPVTSLPATTSLELDAPATSTLLLAYRRPAAPAAPPERLALAQRLLDPVTKQELSGADLRLGQRLTLELTVVVGQHVPHLALDVALPGGLILEAGPTEGAFELLGVSPQGVVQLGAAPMRPGVYQARLSLRAVASGQFGAAPSQLRAPSELGGPINAPAGLDVRITP